MRATAVAALAALVTLTACSSDGAGSTSSVTSEATGDVTTVAGNPTTTLTVPEIDLPSAPPTELVVTDLVTGSGVEAKVGDTVYVHYAGVLSADGTPFDNSYETGRPLPVQLGRGGVIEGWDKGLIGVRQGGRRQLDIPADLAYRDQGRGDVIKPGDALTFVIDVVGVVPVADPADKPDVQVAPATNVESMVTEDLVVGDGPVAVALQTVGIQLTAYRADTGEEIESTWTNGQPVVFVFGGKEILSGIDLAVKGMHVGGRRQATIPFVLAFGETGSEQLGLPPSTDLVVVIDLVAAF